MIQRLREKDRENIYNAIINYSLQNLERTKFYMNFAKMKPVENTAFSKVEYISLVKGRIQGYFAYLFDKVNKKIVNIEVLSFEESPVLVRDFLKFCEFVQQNFNNIELSIIPESPAYKIAIRCFKQYGFIKVGTFRNSVLLKDKKYYSLEWWERKRGGTARAEQLTQ